MKPVDSLIQRADDILSGRGAVTEDWRDALELYKTATKFESGLAYFKIGDLYLHFEHLKLDLEKALFNYKQALRLGCIPAASGMASVYYLMDDKENCLKLWDFYFKNVEEEKNIDFVLETFEYAQHSYVFSEELALYISNIGKVSNIFPNLCKVFRVNINMLYEEDKELMLKFEYTVDNDVKNHSMLKKIEDKMEDIQESVGYYNNLRDYIFSAWEKFQK